MLALENAPQFELTYKPVQLEPWKVEEAYLRWQFEGELARYRSAREAEHGVFKVQPKNEPLHYQWLVEFQVLGMSHSQIRDAHPKDDTELFDQSAISDALHKTAKLIELPLRPHDKGGRPPNP